MPQNSKKSQDVDIKNIVKTETGDDLGDLKKQFDNVQNRNRALNTKMIFDKNKLKDLRTDILRKLLESLQKAGVDINNLESISNFLQQLELQDPDLKIIFENIFNNLTEGTEFGQEASPGISETPQAPQGQPQQGMSQAFGGENSIDRLRKLSSMGNTNA